MICLVVIFWIGIDGVDRWVGAVIDGSGGCGWGRGVTGFFGVFSIVSTLLFRGSYGWLVIGLLDLFV